MECNITGARPVGLDGRLALYARIFSYLVDHPDSTRGQVLEGIGYVDRYDYRKHGGYLWPYFQKMEELGFISGRKSGRNVIFRPGMKGSKLHDSLFESSTCFVIRGNYVGDNRYLTEAGAVYVSGNGIPHSPYRLTGHVNGAEHFWTRTDARMLMDLMFSVQWKEQIECPEILPVEMKFRRPYRFKRGL